MRLWGKTVFSVKCPCFVVTFRRSALYMLHPILASSGLYSNERFFISCAVGWIPTLSEENSLTWFKILSGSGNSMALFFAGSEPPFTWANLYFFMSWPTILWAFAKVVCLISVSIFAMCSSLCFSACFFNALCCLFPMRPFLKASSTDVVIYFLAIFYGELATNNFEN